MEFTFEVHDDVHDMATTVGWAVSDHLRVEMMLIQMVLMMMVML